MGMPWVSAPKPNDTNLVGSEMVDMVVFGCPIFLFCAGIPCVYVYDVPWRFLVPLLNRLLFIFIYRSLMVPA